MIVFLLLVLIALQVFTIVDNWRSARDAAKAIAEDAALNVLRV